MEPMSPKLQAIITLVVGVLAGLGYVATDLTNAGFTSAGKDLLVLVTLASLVQSNRLPALFGKHAPETKPEAPKETPAS
jgi:hypothetical protein